MMNVKLVCMGKVKEDYFKKAIAEYEKRLRPLCKFEIIEIPEQRLPENPSQAEINNALDKEAQIILSKASGKLVSLCIEGKAVDSVGLSKIISNSMNSPGSMSFIIGSSFGLSDKIKDISQNISMSKLTFPHTLARVMLTEQIYRGFQIIGNTKYHK